MKDNGDLWSLIKDFADHPEDVLALAALAVIGLCAVLVCAALC